METAPIATPPRRAGFLGVYDAACLLTLAGALAAFAGLALASRGRVELALVALMLAGLADLFDGVLARRLRRDAFARAYGTQLDTVVDVVAFVAAPAAIALHAGVWSWPGLAGMGLFVLAGITRLAHFNTLAVMGVDQSTHHRGLPVTYTALLFPLLFLARDFAPSAFPFLLAGAFPLLALLFVIDVPVRKPRGAFYLLLPALAAGLIVYWTWRQWP